ncbi:hypothetical protein, partial [Marinimicrobium sp. ARAG 43.8]|uniref:hypothetical protein n=1 Tax=Marinimicrobium sp. ARAG 43.8 TaxID=3418719 RepID=UPI003CEB6B40
HTKVWAVFVCIVVWVGEKPHPGSTKRQDSRLAQRASAQSSNCHTSPLISSPMDRRKERTPPLNPFGRLIVEDYMEDLLEYYLDDSDDDAADDYSEL